MSDADPWGDFIKANPDLIPKGAAAAPAPSGDTSAPANSDPWEEFIKSNPDVAGATQAQNPTTSDGVVTGSAPVVDDSRPLTIHNAGRKIDLVGSNLLHGVESGIGFAGDIQKAGDKLLPEYLGGLGNLLTNPKIDWSDPLKAPNTQDVENQPTLPTTSDISAPTDKLGLTNNPSLVPQTPTERYLAAGAEGVGAAIPTLMTGGALPVIHAATEGAKILPVVASQTAKTVLPSVAGSEAAQGVADAGGGGAAQTGAAIVAGLAAHGGMSALNNRIAKGQFNYQVAQAAQELTDANAAHNIAAAQANASQTAKTGAQLEASQQALEDAKAHFDETNLATVAAAKQQAEQIANNSNAVVEKIASAHGNASTLESGGTALQNEARNWLANVHPAKQDALWNPINEQASNISGTLDSFHDALDSLSNKGGDLANVANSVRGNLPQRLQTALSKAHEESGGIYSWNDMKELRSTLGDMMSNPKAINDGSAKTLKQLYGSLTDDMKSSLEGVKNSSGKPLVNDFNKANVESSRLYDLASGPISRIVASKTPSLTHDPAPASVAASLLSDKGGRDIAALRGEIPQGINQLAATHLRTDPDSWRKMSPETKAALVPGDATRAALDHVLANKAQAEADVKSVTDGVKTRASAPVAQAKAQLAATKKQLAAQADLDAKLQTAAAERVKAAADAHKKLTDSIKSIKPSNPLVRGLSHVMQSYEMGELGARLGKHLPFEHGELAGRVLGLATPSLLRAGGAVNSRAAHGAMTMGAIGANALGATAPPLTIHKGQ